MALIPVQDLLSLSAEELQRKYSVEDIQESLSTVQALEPQREPAKLEPQREPAKRDDRFFETTPFDPNRDFYDQLGTLVGNIPASGEQMVRGLAQTVSHPVDTFNALREAGLSGIAEGLKDRYGGIENIKRTAVEDPVGLAADASIFTGPGAIRAAGSSSNIVRGLGRLGRATSPSAAVISGVKAPPKAARTLTREAAAALSGVDPKAISIGARESMRGTPEARAAFREGVRGHKDITELPGRVREVQSIMREQQAIGAKANRASFPKEPINRKIWIDEFLRPAAETLKSRNIETKIKLPNRPVLDVSGAEGVRALGPGQIGQLKKGFKQLAEIDFPETVEQLYKRRADFDVIVKKLKDPRIESIATGLRAQYTKFLESDNVGGAAMRQFNLQYSTGSNTRRQLESVLKFGARDEQFLKSLVSSIAESRPINRAMIQKAEQATGFPIRATASGLEFGEATARGLIGRSLASKAFQAIIGFGLVTSFDPTLIPLLLLTSPRVIGEAILSMGTVAQPLRPVLKMAEVLGQNKITRGLVEEGMSFAAILGRLDPQEDEQLANDIGRSMGGGLLATIGNAVSR